MPFFAVTPTQHGYQHDAFQWGFLVMDIIPSFTDFNLSREFQTIEAGQAVFITCKIQDLMTTIGQRFDFDPNTTPQIEIYNPDGTVRVAFTNMNFITTGVYGYQHQTLTSHPTGIYTGRFQAVHGTMTGRSEEVTLFRVT